MTERKLLLETIERMVRCGYEFVGNIWNGRFYEITLARNGRRPTVFASNMPLLAIVDAKGSIFYEY